MQSLLQSIQKLDQNLFLSLNRLQSIKLNRIIFQLTKLGGLFFQTILVTGLLIIPTTRELGYKIGAVQIAVTIIVQLIKAICARVRPYNALVGVKPFKIEKDYSFPSGHSAASFATATVLATTFAMSGAFFFGVAALIGYSRIYIGVHYPTDVIVGSFLGIGMTIVLLAIF